MDYIITDLSTLSLQINYRDGIHMSLEKMKIITNLNAMQYTASLPFGDTNI